ncbi:3446_t:CDS:2, partial [Acaulospora morrowiae]
SVVHGTLLLLLFIRTLSLGFLTKYEGVYGKLSSGPGQSLIYIRTSWDKLKILFSIDSFRLDLLQGVDFIDRKIRKFKQVLSSEKTFVNMNESASRKKFSYENLIELLHLKQESNPIASQHFYSYGITYLLACHEDGLQKHFFCSDEFRDISTELLDLFSLIETDESVERFKKILTEQLLNCTDCVRTYHAQKTKLKRRNLVAYNDTRSVNRTFSIIDSWDEDRIITALTTLKLQHTDAESSDVGPSRKSVEKTLTTIFYEMLTSLRLFKNPSVNLLFAQVFQANGLSDIPLTLRQEFPVGVFIASVHEFDSIRKWAWKHMSGNYLIKWDTFVNSGYSDLVKVIIQHFRNLGKKKQDYPFTKKLPAFWKGVRRILSCLDSSAVEHGLCNRTIDFCNLVNSFVTTTTEGSTFIEIGKCLKVLFEKLEKTFWEHSSQPPQIVVGNAFKSEAFMKVAVHFPNQCKHLFEWVPAFTESLVDSTDFKDILKDLLEWLLVAFQKANLPIELSLESLKVGTRILEQHNQQLDSSLRGKLKIILSGSDVIYHTVASGEHYNLIADLLLLSDKNSVISSNLDEFGSKLNPIVLDSNEVPSQSVIPVKPASKPSASTVKKPIIKTSRKNKRVPISMNPAKKSAPKQQVGKMWESFVKEQREKIRESMSYARENNKIIPTKTNTPELKVDAGSVSGEHKKSDPIILRKPPAAPRRTKLLDINEVISYDVRRARAEKERREKEDVMHRLKPNLKNLYKTVLSWDFDTVGDIPPNSSQSSYKQVPDRFNSVEEYQEIFEPLLILELWQGFMQSKEEVDENDVYNVIIEHNASVDDLVEVSAFSNIPLRTLSENDLLLIKQSEEKQQPDKRDRNVPPKKCLSLVKWSSSNKLSMQCYFENSLNNFRSDLRPGSKWIIEKVFSLTPAAREYAALKAMPYFSFRNLLLQPEIPSFSPIASGDVQKYMKLYKINESQAEAICKVLQKKHGFLLIQGPPGTGKTSTIVSIISALKANSATYKHRILACAPSNAAVDEMERRLNQGIFDSDGNLIKVKVVRFGKNDNSDEGADNTKETNKNRLIELQKSLNEKNRSLKDPKISGWDASILEADIAQINKSMGEIRKSMQTSESSSTDQSDKKEKNIRNNKDKDLAEADIICATLAGSGHDRLSAFAQEFETIIIDEAAQAIELSSIIPLKFNASRCILVGDPNQLPPTVLSRVATRYFYEQSLFNRLQKCVPKSIHMLKTQYRMHPEISRFPSLLFYNSELKNAEGLETSRKQPWHVKSIFAPYKFFDVKGVMSYEKNSLLNSEEAKIAVKLVDRLVIDFPEVDFKGRIGVITPYKSQLSEIRKQFRNKLNRDLYKNIEFNTVDGFQGKEKDIIIFSCVRAGEENSVGFLKDLRRLNVALTRARCSLFILGNRRSLERNELWKKLITDSIDRKCFVDCSGPEFERDIATKPGGSQIIPAKDYIPPSSSDLRGNKRPREENRGYSNEYRNLPRPTDRRDVNWSRDDRNRVYNRGNTSIPHRDDYRRRERPQRIDERVRNTNIDRGGDIYQNNKRIRNS